MSPQPPVRVLIADDHLLFAEALELTLAADKRSVPDCRVSNLAEESHTQSKVVAQR